MSANPTIEEICRKYFIRYSRLRGAIPYAFSNCKGSEINIYIDLYGLYHTIYSRSYRTQITDYVSFTAQMVNICSHYRDFFNRCGLRSKIFLISSFNTPSCIRNMLPGYNQTMEDKKQNKIISEMMSFNFDLLDIMSPYLPDVFFLRTEFESSVLMYELMLREQKPSLIISNDTYPLQLCTLLPDTAYIWPMYVWNENGEVEDISPICPPIGHPEQNISLAYITKRKNGKTTSERLRGAVIASNYVLLQALNQCKERDLPIIFNSSRSTKIINETPGGTINKLYPTDIVKSLGEDNASRFEEIQIRYRALDVTFQHEIFKSSVECKSLHYENLSDPDALNLINSKYFNNNLDLFRL